MTNRNLATVTTDLIESYGNTARNVINAYRVGGERVIGFMDQRWESALDKSAKQLSAEVRGNALSAQKKLSGYCTKGVVLTTSSAETVVQKMVALVGMGVRQVAANASQFEKKTGVTALNRVALAAVPAAEVASKYASKLEQQSSRFANRIAGKKATVKVAAVKRVTPFKKARARTAA